MTNQYINELLEACRINDLENIVKFLEKGTDINLHGYDNLTPVSIALLQENYELALFLINKGANLNVHISQGLSLLDASISDEYYEASDFYGDENNIDDTCTKFLVENGADVNNKNIYGETPLFTAIRYEHYKALELLLNAGADVWARNLKGITAMDYALHSKYQGIINRILEYESDRIQKVSDRLDKQNQELDKIIEKEKKLLNAEIDNEIR